jgi:membrane associated rhomboid family serine protease
MMQMTPMIKQLIVLNVIFFIGSNTIAPIAYDYFALHFPLNEGFRVWQPLTHMFMHAKAPMIMHIFFNMFGLLMFGSPLEHFWGAKKFLFFYISCGLGAALLHVGIDYYQFQQVYDVLISNGVSAQEIQKIVETGEYNTAIEQFVSKQNLTEMYRS